MKGRWPTRPRGGLRGAHTRRALAVALLPVLLSACFAATPTFDASTNPDPLTSKVLTSDGTGDTFVYTRDGGSVTISAPSTNTGGNTRQAYYPADAPVVNAEQSCETWDGDGGDIDQQGIALRIAPTANGLGTRAITVTKNIWYLGYWIFNIHVWDSTSAHPFTQLGSVDLSPILGYDLYHITPYPWHVCARVDGAIFQFIVWTGTNPQPSWDDANAVHQLTLPDGWDYPGRAGWYIGHLKAGDVDTFSDLQTWSLKGPIDPPTTSVTTTTVASTTTSAPTSTVPPDSTTTLPADTTTTAPADTTTTLAAP